jgi:hypothetical protein
MTAPRREPPDAATEILFAFIEEVTAPLPLWARVRIAQGVYKRLEAKTGAAPIGSDAGEMFRALKTWRSRMIWIANGRRIKPPRGA